MEAFSIIAHPTVACQGFVQPISTGAAGDLAKWLSTRKRTNEQTGEGGQRPWVPAGRCSEKRSRTEAQRETMMEAFPKLL
jgi:hypothetical protein